MIRVDLHLSRTYVKMRSDLFSGLLLKMFEKIPAIDDKL